MRIRCPLSSSSSSFRSGTRWDSSARTRKRLGNKSCVTCGSRSSQCRRVKKKYRKERSGGWKEKEIHLKDKMTENTITNMEKSNKKVWRDGGKKRTDRKSWMSTTRRQPGCSCLCLSKQVPAHTSQDLWADSMLLPLSIACNLVVNPLNLFTSHTHV